MSAFKQEGLMQYAAGIDIRSMLSNKKLYQVPSRSEVVQAVKAHDIHAIQEVAEKPAMIEDKDTAEECKREGFETYNDLLKRVGLPSEEIKREIKKLETGMETRGTVIVDFAKTINSISEGR